ncbi:MAG: hypothetical protein CUN57_01140, partial [Phototrophicales bacterium]
MNQTKFTHPNPRLYRLTQWLMFVVLCVVIVTVPLQLLIAVMYPKAVLFYLLALITLGLSAPLILYLTVTPTVSIHETGLTVHPFIGKSHLIDWEDVQAVKDYPLLPRQNHEVNKRLVVGRKRYKQAEGIMLIVPCLPMVYRVGGFFAGERGRKIIALTNRTHTDYD